MPDPAPREASLTVPLLALLAFTAIEAAIAARWGLLADEAYYWGWSQAPALGYLDHPPAVAWLIAAVPWDTSLGVRAGPIACGVVAWAALHDLTPRPALLAALLAGVPMLAVSTFFATPDAPLLAGWALAMRGAAKGGPHWLLAGAGVGIALLAKLSGVLLLPVLVATAPRDLRTRWPWLGLGLAAAMVAPTAAWAVANDWPFVRWQLGHGLTGGGDPVAFLVGQALAPTPLVAIAAAWWLVIAAPAWAQWWHAVPDERTRVARSAWASAVVPLAVFGAAAPFGPPEANWTAPAWLGACLGISCWAGPSRLGWAGAALGGLLVAALVVEVEVPWMPGDPGARVLEGSALSRALENTGPLDAPLVTERYQEASLVWYHSGSLPPRHASCGRPDTLPRWAGDGPAWLLRPARSGDTACDGRVRVTGPPVRLDVSDGRRAIGRWQLVPIAPLGAVDTP